MIRALPLAASLTCALIASIWGLHIGLHSGHPSGRKSGRGAKGCAASCRLVDPCLPCPTRRHPNWWMGGQAWPARTSGSGYTGVSPRRRGGAPFRRGADLPQLGASFDQQLSIRRATRIRELWPSERAYLPMHGGDLPFGAVPWCQHRPAVAADSRHGRPHGRPFFRLQRAVLLSLWHSNRRQRGPGR